jgi:hypothetical protein
VEVFLERLLLEVAAIALQLAVIRVATWLWHRWSRSGVSVGVAVTS